MSVDDVEVQRRTLVVELALVLRPGVAVEDVSDRLAGECLDLVLAAVLGLVGDPEVLYLASTVEAVEVGG